MAHVTAPEVTSTDPDDAATAVFNPASDLATGTVYSATLTAGVC